nr:DNA-directed DNA polymerase [Tanacetum cinerariifolium]
MKPNLTRLVKLKDFILQEIIADRGISLTKWAVKKKKTTKASGDIKSELEYDPQIEKTAKKLRKKARKRNFQKRSSSSWLESSESNFIYDLFDQFTISGEGEENTAERTLWEMATQNINQQSLCIQYPPLTVPFGLKSGLIHLLPTFCGLASEDPYKHLRNFTWFV